MKKDLQSIHTNDNYAVPLPPDCSIGEEAADEFLAFWDGGAPLAEVFARANKLSIYSGRWVLYKMKVRSPHLRGRSP